jgi:Flp pilus assembly protein TadD
MGGGERLRSDVLTAARRTLMVLAMMKRHVRWSLVALAVATTGLYFAENAARAETIVASIERLWTSSGSPTADLLIQRAIATFAAGQKGLAQRLLDAVVELQPDNPEGFNRRAYVYYAQQDYSRALGDLRRVLALEPRHFRAMEGLAQILRSMGEKKGALDAYKELLKAHPNSPGAGEAVKDLTREVEGQGI